MWCVPWDSLIQPRQNQRRIPSSRNSTWQGPGAERIQRFQEVSEKFTWPNCSECGSRTGCRQRSAGDRNVSSGPRPLISPGTSPGGLSCPASQSPGFYDMALPSPLLPARVAPPLPLEAQRWYLLQEASFTSAGRITSSPWTPPGILPARPHKYTQYSLPMSPLSTTELMPESPTLSS